MLGHLHGKNAVIYLGAQGGTAVFLGEMVDWSLDGDQAIVDISSLNQSWKNFVKGMMGWTCTLAGNFNLSSSQMFSAWTSDVPENFYLYITKASMTQYYYGTAWVQLTKIAAGSTTAKASTSLKLTGDGQLYSNP